MVWYSESAWWIQPRPTPTPAGDKPPRYIFSFRHRPSVYNSAGFAGGEPDIQVDWRAHFRTNDESRGRNEEGMPRMTNERLLERAIPDRSPGLAFLPMAVTKLISLSLNSSAVAILVAQIVKR